MAADRFFSATLIAGRIHVLGLAPGGLWDPARLEWREEPELDTLVNPRAGDRKITSREELEDLLHAPADAPPPRFLWIHERLAGEARRLWERGSP